VGGKGISRGPASGRRTRRRRIVDRRDASGDGLREDPLSLEGGRHGGDAHAPDALPASLVVHEEERPVLLDRPAQDEAELVAAELWLVRVARRAGGEEVPRVQAL